MKHEIGLFDPRGKIGKDWIERDGGKTIWPTSLTFLGVNFIQLLTLIHFQYETYDEMGHTSYKTFNAPGDWHWSIFFVTLAVAVLWPIIVNTMVKTHAVYKLKVSDKKGAYRNFLKLSPETQASLGGKKNFYNTLVYLNDKDAATVLKETRELVKAQDRAIEARYDNTIRQDLIEAMRREKEGLHIEAKSYEENMGELS